jgi:hypothetical protein
MKIKNVLSAAALCTASVLALSSCSKEKEQTAAASAAVSQDALAQIKSLGFSTQDVRAVEGGYVVEATYCSLRNCWPVPPAILPFAWARTSSTARPTS